MVSGILSEGFRLNIAVPGVGYADPVSGACFAEPGNRVTCRDTDEHKIGNLNRGKISIYEPELEDLLLRFEAKLR
uniref:UDP-glucose 6-dehydrogenase n=1 Tax=Candidatus Kentrum sp. LPFa TaxID=2126335 RepID=A0A450WI34_9GAMM|nr:MAG: UDP-glucose/GDP-mannose dehydrogenase family, NAD binding domain [Candidatus Kentron sp. LPFa]